MFLLILSACAVKKPKTSNIEVGKAVSSSEKKTLINQLEANQIIYSTFNGKAKTKLEINNKTFNATLNLRIKHQETIWISVTAFMGIEVARVLITPDRIKIMNRLQSEYTDKPFEYIYNFTGKEMGFDEVESLLVGNSLKFTFNPQADFFYTSLGFEVQGNYMDLDFVTQFGKDYTLLQNKFSQNGANQALTSNYDEFQEIMGQTIPRDVQILVKADKLELNAIMNYNNIGLNDELSYPFQVPSSFKQTN
jgi:hypothetical protein